MLSYFYEGLEEDIKVHVYAVFVYFYEDEVDSLLINIINTRILHYLLKLHGLQILCIQPISIRSIVYKYRIQLTFDLFNVASHLFSVDVELFLGDLRR